MVDPNNTQSLLAKSVVTPVVANPNPAPKVVVDINKTEGPMGRETGRTWAGMFTTNKLGSKDMNLTYVPPVIEEVEIVYGGYRS